MKKEITIGDLAWKISSLMGSKIVINTDDQRVRPENSEVERLFCDNTKLIKNTNWQPDYDLEKGLVETIEWLKKNISLYKPQLYNV